MPEPYLPEDEAALYVMGELSPDERREFMTRLAESAELRSLVREIEEGMVAVALAAPPLQPPPKIWTRIEKTVAGEAKRGLLRPDFRGGAWANGWAAAAACLIGWLLYALWMNHPAKPGSRATFADSHPQQGNAQTDSAPGIVREVKPPSPTEIDKMRVLLQAKARDEAALRAQMADLENRVMRMAKSLAQQQALLNETSRLKFVQLTPVSGDGTAGTNINLSPELQRALALAVARELGWLQQSNINFTGDSNSITGTPLATNFANVDFVDLHPGATSGATVSSSPNHQTAQASDDTTAPPAATTPNPIPAFISGSNLVMAIDATIAAKNSQLTFMGGALAQGQQTLGAAIMGDNSMVVTIPLGFGSGDGVDFGDLSQYYTALPSGLFGVSVVAGTGPGTSNVFQYYIGGTNAP